VILVLTNEQDLTTDFVVRELRPDEFIRINTERLGEQGELTYEFGDGGDVVTLANESKRISVDKITAVYSRRSGIPEAHADIEDPGIRAYARAEFAALIDALAHMLDVPWVNHPHAVRRAEVKPLQLRMARQCGLRVPRTLVTNNPARARAFAEHTRSELVIKTLASPRVRIGGRDHIMFTSLLPHAAPQAFDDLALAPCIIQEHLPKEVDLRVTVVGADVFAVEIDSQSMPAAAVDWRAGMDVPHRLHRLPPQLVEACSLLCRRLGLTFGALDFVLDRAGNYVFLEINPSGQWAWLELLTGVPIAASIAQSLRGR
jgi:glutathione synthase/RimK-type ligase-like ATP-grasp enzyme